MNGSGHYPVRVQRFRGTRKRLHKLRLTRKEKWQGAAWIALLFFASVAILFLVGRLEQNEEATAHTHRQAR